MKFLKMPRSPRPRFPRIKRGPSGLPLCALDPKVECPGDRNMICPRIRADLAKAPVASGNVLSERFDVFRCVFERVRRENSSCLGRMYSIKSRLMKKAHGFLLCDEMTFAEQCEWKRCQSLQTFSGNADVLTPILEALPHLKLGAPGKLDSTVSGNFHWGTGCFSIRDGEQKHHLSVVLDGTPESAWEYVLLNYASEQFFFHWHAAVHRRSIITDIRRADEEMPQMLNEHDWCRIGEEGRQRLLMNDFTPRVRIADGQASVSYYYFSRFRGLCHRVQKISMDTTDTPNDEYDFMGDFEDECDECLVPYHCGIVF